jgi:hypothetical protein
MDKCDYCGEPFTRKRARQRFCNMPGKNCRQLWHREHADLPGTVKGVRQLAGGGWSVTIHQPTQPSVQIGTRARIETTAHPRPDASHGTNTMEGG